MTDPTPTRAEVEHHPRPDLTDLAVQEWAAYRSDDAGAVARKLLAENFALRERAEAAEDSLASAKQLEQKAFDHSQSLQTALTAARRAEAAAWNDAIEAAANVSGHYMSDDADETLLDMWREDIRALRRAAPTERGMSAPRKIWAAHPNHERHFSARSFSDPDLPAHLYHHDDVVRELVEALKGLLHHEIAHVGPHAGARVIAARAALAKIAQEG